MEFRTPFSLFIMMVHHLQIPSVIFLNHCLLGGLRALHLLEIARVNEATCVRVHERMSERKVLSKHEY